LHKQSNRRLDTPDFDCLLLGTIRVDMVAVPDFASFDAGKAVFVGRKELLLVFTDADRRTRPLKYLLTQNRLSDLMHFLHWLR
jgi:hypothetical protein